MAPARTGTLGVYVHVPWCGSRCGYCDFNTYVPGRVRGASPEGFAAAAVAELALHGIERPADTVFLGGGTPTLLPVRDLAAILRAIPLAPGAEVTVEANPESVDAARLAALREAGFNRVSIGMQSAVRHVLRTLERAHTPGRAAAVARAARAAGFERVSLDLIYGAPGESDDDWRHSLDAALAAEPGHVSAYALTLEPGTRMTAAVRAGRLPAPAEEAQRRRYLIAEEMLAGLGWYEISNWGDPCRHNLGYWRGGDWIGVGPGAHSHRGGVRRWNVRHPARWAERVAAGRLPEDGRESPDAAARRLESLMLGIRLAEGIPDDGRAAADDLVARGLVERRAGRLVLTLEGRLLADLVVRSLA